jgi:hypothetical protein
MNNTKWNEIFKTFYNSNHIVRWRTKDRETDYQSDWDASWSHFGCEPREWELIDFLQIELTYTNKEYVIESLKKIHVPAEIKGNIVTVYGYRMDVDYL